MFEISPLFAFVLGFLTAITISLIGVGIFAYKAHLTQQETARALFQKKNHKTQ